MSAAAERQNADGTVDVLVAFRVKVSNIQAADQEQGYRLRVHMAPVDGTFKVALIVRGSVDIYFDETDAGIFGMGGDPIGFNQHFRVSVIRCHGESS